MRPTETPRPAVLNSEMRWVPPSSRSMPAVPTRSTTRAVDLSLKRQIALPEIAVTAPTCTWHTHLLISGSCVAWHHATRTLQKVSMPL